MCVIINNSVQFVVYRCVYSPFFSHFLDMLFLVGLGVRVGGASYNSEVFSCAQDVLCIWKEMAVLTK